MNEKAIAKRLIGMAEALVAAAEDKWNVFGKRDGKMGKWNKSPMSKSDAEDLMDDIKKAKIPSVDSRSLEMKLAHDLTSKKGEVPEAFKKQWKNKDKDNDGKENEPKPDFLEKKDKKASLQLATLYGKDLTADELLDNDSNYREFVAGAKKFGGRYKGDGVVDFSQLGLRVNMSGNETKFYFSFGKVSWGRLWSAEDALKALKAIDNIRRKIGMEGM